MIKLTAELARFRAQMLSCGWRIERSADNDDAERVT